MIKWFKHQNCISWKYHLVIDRTSPFHHGISSKGKRLDSHPDIRLWHQTLAWFQLPSIRFVQASDSSSTNLFEWLTVMGWYPWSFKLLYSKNIKDFQKKGWKTEVITHYQLFRQSELMMLPLAMYFLTRGRRVASSCFETVIMKTFLGLSRSMAPKTHDPWTWWLFERPHYK